MRNIVLLGAGGHCKSCIEIIENLEKDLEKELENFTNHPCPSSFSGSVDMQFFSHRLLWREK